MENEFRDGLQGILDFHRNEWERLEKELEKTSENDQAKRFCITGEIHSLKKSFDKLRTFLQNDAMCTHLAITVEDNIRQGCKLANLEVTIAELKREKFSLEKELNISKRDTERLSDKFQKSEQCRLQLEDALNKIRELSVF